MNKQLKPSFAILLICYIWHTSDWGAGCFCVAVSAPEREQAATLGSHQSNLYFIKALVS